MRLNRISLNTISLNRIGLNRIGFPSRGSSSSSERPYIDPEVLASLKAVCICYGKSNDDEDRAIIKNLVDPDNPFVISNATYTEGSGYADKDSPYYGAFITDGVDDLITSTKTMSEMLGDSKECTVLSMIAILGSEQIMCNSNYSELNGYNVRNTLEPNGVISMLGYTDNNDTTNNLNLIMGDKNSIELVDKVNFNSTRVFHPTSYNSYSYKTAYYWTFISNKVLTSDQINQVIAHFNLDRCVGPLMYLNTIKQGITNENHADFDDMLTDYSGNGHNVQLYNIGWKGNSGIGKYEVDFTEWSKSGKVTFIDYKSVTWFSENSYHIIYFGTDIAYDIPSFIAHIETSGIVYYTYIDSSCTKKAITISVSGDYEFPMSYNTLWTGEFDNIGFTTSGGKGTIVQIPSHQSALVTDGINDFGMAEGLPILKDYTVFAGREVIDNDIQNADGSVATRGANTDGGAFCFDYKSQTVSFGGFTDKEIDVNSTISYQSKYVNNGIAIKAGTITDANPLLIAKLGTSNERYSKIALSSFLLFPYSLSEFLLERQLKRYKIGTLYPDMVEFRPIVKSNLPYSSISYSVNPGEYISVDSMVTITVTLPNASDKLMEISCNAISDISISGDNGVYKIMGKVVKSPQKINIVISSYLTMISNSTLISNKTLIKNE